MSGLLSLQPAPRRIGVFRALQLGDMLCAVPALRSIRAAWPRARLTLIGLPWARTLCERLPCLDAFIEFPGHPLLPERVPDARGWARFERQVHAADLDLLVQLHGSGRVLNEMLAALPARVRAGFCEPDGSGDSRPGREWHLHWPQQGHEIERLLRLTQFLGLPDTGTGLDFPLREADLQAAAALTRDVHGPYVCVHPGARLPSRRWPPQCFAAVADALAARGFAVLITGSAEEAELARAVREAMRQPALDLSGRTELWTLGALVEGARLVLCNDTGISHVAAALHRPSVVVSCGADVARWAPLDARLHRVLAKAVDCRPCMHLHCPIGHPCATGVSVAAVLAAAELQLWQSHAGSAAAATPAPGRRAGIRIASGAP